ncbi:DUF6274 family protein [Streptomyces megasporus]|uniref:DUF6274 family protein n=1 Tax=Streptomyces megasporus TaxID=44060 RepID=UPI0009988E65|nr:DUF6274 family protein [Streptomyces megasporus]
MPTTPNPPRSPRHEIRALLRAHLAAAARYGHATHRCPVCHRLRLLAMEPANERPRARPEPELSPEPSPDGPPSPSPSPAVATPGEAVADEEQGEGEPATVGGR